MERPVPVVRLIVKDADGRVLILRRHDSEHGNRKWCLPGGKVDYGDTVAETVAKELKEETSLECLESQYLFFQDSVPAEPGKMHCINLYFECKTSGELRLNAESQAFAIGSIFTPPPRRLRTPISAPSIQTAPQPASARP